MKILIVYYSRTNTTKQIAEELAKRLNADTEEIIDLKSRAGVMGYITGGKDAYQCKLTKIEQTKKIPAEYDLLIVGTPVWAGAMTPAVRTYLENEKTKINKIAFFVTQGAMPPKQENIFGLMEQACSKSSKANLHLSTKQVKASDFEKEISEFVNKIMV